MSTDPPELDPVAAERFAELVGNDAIALLVSWTAGKAEEADETKCELAVQTALFVRRFAQKETLR